MPLFFQLSGFALAVTYCRTTLSPTFIHQFVVRGTFEEEAEKMRHGGKETEVVIDGG
jgi:hypothetical protein